MIIACFFQSLYLPMQIAFSSGYNYVVSFSQRRKRKQIIKNKKAFEQIRRQWKSQMNY